jgi:hypothetical protein
MGLHFFSFFISKDKESYFSPFFFPLLSFSLFFMGKSKKIKERRGKKKEKRKRIMKMGDIPLCK